jgi:hypothetical protein
MRTRYTAIPVTNGYVIWDSQFAIPVRTTQEEFEARVLCDAFNEAM